MEIRDLEHIRERPSLGASTRLSYWILGAIGAAALVVAAFTGRQPEGTALESPADPLGDLIAETLAKGKTPQRPSPFRLQPSDASFAEVLVDREAPSTAIVVVKDEQGRLIDAPPSKPRTPAAAAPPAAAPATPAPAALPLAAEMTRTRLTTRPKDPLTRSAATSSTEARTTDGAQAGSPGGYQIQISSFEDSAEAERVAEELRTRGHPAHVETAQVGGRGTWHRVRLGPFAGRAEALAAKKAFEEQEGVVTLLIDPRRGG